MIIVAVMESKLKRYSPFLLTIALVILDQISKAIVIRSIPLGTIKTRLFGDFIWIVHVRNTGMAFSLAADSPIALRVLILILVPTALMVAIAYAIIKKPSMLTPCQRWFAAGIMGGGIGTLIDRVFRFDEGVVDFVSIKLYGFLGMNRWPTFNVSDSCVVVFVILMMLSMLISMVKERKEGK